MNYNRDSGKLQAGDYLIINADKGGDEGTYLSFRSTASSVLTYGPLYAVVANQLELSGDKAISWRVNFPPNFEESNFSLQCVWMGSRGRGQSNFGTVVVSASFNKAKLSGEIPPTPIRAHPVPNLPGHFYLEFIDEKKGKNTYLYASGCNVKRDVNLKSMWKFVRLDKL